MSVIPPSHRSAASAWQLAGDLDAPAGRLPFPPPSSKQPAARRTFDETTSNDDAEMEEGEVIDDEEVEPDEKEVTLGEAMLIDSDEEAEDEEEDASIPEDEEVEEEEEDLSDQLYNILRTARVTTETRELFESILEEFNDLWADENHPLYGIAPSQFLELVMFYENPDAFDVVKALWHACQAYLAKEEQEYEGYFLTVEQEDDEMDVEDESDRKGKLDWMKETLTQYKKVFGVDFKWSQIQPLLISTDVMAQLNATLVSTLLAEIPPIDADAPVSDLPMWSALAELDPDQPNDQMRFQALTAIMDLAIEVADDEIEDFEALQDKNTEIMNALDRINQSIRKLLDSFASSTTPATSSSIASSAPNSVQAELQRESKSLSDFIASCESTDKDFSDIEPIPKVRGFGGAGFATSSAHATGFGGAPRSFFGQQPFFASTSSTATSATTTTAVEPTPEAATTDAIQSLIITPSASDRLKERIPKRQEFLTNLHQRVSELVSTHPEIAALWRDELRHLSTVLEQRRTDTVVPTRSMELLIREIGQDYKNDLQFEPEALDMIQEAAEQFLTQQFDESGRYRVEANTGIAGFTRQEIETAPVVPLERLIPPYVNPLCVSGPFQAY